MFVISFLLSPCTRSFTRGAAQAALQARGQAALQGTVSLGQRSKNRMCFKARSKARKVPGFFPYLTTIAVQCIVSQSIESCRSAIGQPHTHPIRVALHPPRASLDDAH